MTPGDDNQGDESLVDDGERIAAIIATYPPVEQTALRSVLTDYQAGKFNRDKVKLLTDAGILIGPVKAKKVHTEVSSDLCETQDELRNRIMLHFQNADGTSKLRREISKQEISAWRNSKELNGAPPPPKPVDSVKKRWSLRSWIEWFEKYMLWSDEFRRDDSAPADGKDYKVMSMGELEQVTKRERLEKERFDIMVEKGEYIKLTQAESLVAGEASRIHLHWKNQVENIPMDGIESKMQQLEIAPEKSSAMMNYLAEIFQGITNAIEDGEASMARELSRILKAQVELNKK